MLIISNPTAGQKKNKTLTKAMFLLKESGANITLHETKFAGDATLVTQKMLSSDTVPDMIVAVGGDGTFCEIAKGVPNNIKTSLGILPCGTANVLSFEQNISRKVPFAVDTLLTGKVKNICIPKLNGERFCLMVGVGIDSLAVNSVNKNLKRKIGPLAYIVAAFKAAKRFKEMDFIVESDGISHATKSVIVTNSKKYGGPFNLAPKADMSDPCLHLVLMNNAGIWAAIRYGIALIFGRMDKLSDVEIIRAYDILIKGPKDFPVQADGDDRTVLPVRIKTSIETLSLIVPR